ncbi:hypothetical protein [Acinetobacter proteolyticus]|nr:hypothetical protein [Acinetobacter proteolyticus]
MSNQLRSVGGVSGLANLGISSLVSKATDALRGGSVWDNLNPNLIASIYEVDHNGFIIAGTAVVQAVFSDEIDLEASLNWQSPFEGAGAESKAPALMSMLQSGAFQPLIDSIGGKTKEILQDTVNEARGRTGITKLNSTQVFSGMPPIKINGSLLLRAWENPVREVENPLDTLMRWSLPYYLAPEGTLLSNAFNFSQGNGKTLIETIMPSEAPPLVAVTYKGRTYAPLVIESIKLPLGSPIDANGNFTSMLIPVTFSTLTAMDGNDWMKTSSRGF